MEWFVFTGVVIWLTSTAVLWLRLVALESRMAELREELAEQSSARSPSQGRVAEHSEERPLAFAAGRDAGPEPTPAGSNFSRRVQVLRMHRRGESLSEIASLVGISTAEAELVIKLHAQGLSVVRKS